MLLWATEPLLILGVRGSSSGERVDGVASAPPAIAIVGLGLVVLDPAAGGSTSEIRP